MLASAITAPRRGQLVIAAVTSVLAVLLLLSDVPSTAPASERSAGPAPGSCRR